MVARCFCDSDTVMRFAALGTRSRAFGEPNGEQVVCTCDSGHARGGRTGCAEYCLPAGPELAGSDGSSDKEESAGHKTRGCGRGGEALQAELCGVPRGRRLRPGEEACS